MDLGPNVTLLERDGRRFYLVGTAHISERSVREVRETIEKVRPDTVCIELCETRYQSLVDSDRWKKLDIFQLIKQGKVLFTLANLALSAYQRRLGEKLGVRPGAEQLEAVKVAEETGAQLILADRDIQATLKRTWRSLSFWNKVKVLGSLNAGFFGSGEEITEESLEKLKDRDTLTETMQAFAEELPQIQRPLIDERDQFLMSAVEDAPGDTVVAVVGAGHVPGMQRYLGKPIDRDALSVIPPPGPWGRVIKWTIPTLILLAFWWGYSQNQGQSFERMLLAWIIPNAVLAAVLTAAVLAKPLSIIVAALASPITSLNPTIGAGMVVGLVEAWLRKPTVADAEELPHLTGIKQSFKNPFVRVLIVAAAATLGSALGAWVGGFLVATYL
ncbi:MAG: TraB/GumN family protein [Myxococcales bacterium]|nr:TraB/GumN family protein [Myxococcales bacterium]MCB9547571.1 TraB/GumN family protein [Myxococcales bacterium]